MRERFGVVLRDMRERFGVVYNDTHEEIPMFWKKTEEKVERTVRILVEMWSRRNKVIDR